MRGLWLKATVFLVLATGYAFSVITSTNTYEDKSCRYVVQVNEGNQVLFSETIEIPGWYGKTSCYETSYTGCLVNTSTDDYIKGMRKLGSHTFADSIGQECYLKGLKPLVGSIGCFNTTPYVYGLSYTLTCEVPAAVPAYCGKSESYTKQVLLARHEMECEALGGTFTGGVYPVTQADGSEEYCVSGSCAACDSDWRNNLMKNWKDSVCCEKRALEPNPNNGTCVEARSMDSTQIGVSYPKITAFPGCSGTKAGEGENYCNVEPSSSSSSSDTDQQTSSSSAEPVSSSSSEDQEDANCYATDMDAKAALANADWQCKREGNTPNFHLDGQKCLTGSCDDGASSSSIYSSDSGDDGDGGNSSSSEDGECLANSGPLLKNSNDNNGWVYVGKEVYGNRSTYKTSLKSGAKIFDALGRAYNNMVAKIKYLVSKGSIEKRSNEVPLEFEVYKKIIADDEGNDIEIFRKEDDKNGLRRDSTAFVDGRWEVFEIKGETEVSLKNSLGIKTTTIRDHEGKLSKRILVDETGDTIVYNKYRWKDGLLIKEIGLNGTRTYTYGDNPYEDTVRVSPSDNGLYFHQGYDGSVGMIPKKSDVNYESYLANPYGVWLVLDGMSSEIRTAGNVLKKGNYNFPTLVPEMPIPTYHNTPWTDISKTECQKSGRCLPIPYNGRSYLAPRFTNASCSCNDGKYLMEYEIIMHNASIELLQSFISLDLESIVQGKDKKWMRNCLTKGEIQDTYEHEVKHHKNALNKMIEQANKYMPTDKFETYEECKESSSKASKIIVSYMNEWLFQEQTHLTEESPKNTGLKQGERCDE